jgi:hypothetical protein
MKVKTFSSDSLQTPPDTAKRVKMFSGNSHQTYPDTQFMRALAMVLIFNSHLDLYYPIRNIGTGGAIGNSIFFFLSAYGIYISQQKHGKPFSEWLKGRIGRIYPSMWIALILLRLPILLGSHEFPASYVTTYIGHFFNPPHWFLRALLVFSILSFLFLNNKYKTKVPIVIGALSILYITCYLLFMDIGKWSIESPPFYLIHYFMIFLFGIYIASKSKPVSYTGIHNYFIFILMIAAIYGHKFLMTKGLFPEFQFIQQLAMYPLVYYLLKISRSPFMTQTMMQKRAIASPINFISDHSLELYIVQETIVSSVHRLNLPFPASLLTFIFLTCVFSAVINKLAGMLRERIY